jgi:uncharacterized damage-inducible protein DinB
MAKDILRDLFDHMEWADARVWEAALKTPEAQDDDTLRWLILHLHTVQHAFLDAWTNQTFAFRSDFSQTTLQSELASTRAYYARGRSFLASLDEVQLGASVVLPWTKWAEQQLGSPAGPTTLGETILQVLTHSTHHRAQVNTRLRALGAEPPMVDFIAWLWMQRPAPSWPDVAAS